MGPAAARPTAWGQLAAEPGTGAQALGRPQQAGCCLLLRLFIPAERHCIFYTLSAPDIPAQCPFTLLPGLPISGL